MDVEVTPSDSTVFVKEIATPADLQMPPYYGKKAILGGDTYELLSSQGEDLASEVDWDSAHLTFNGDIESWMIDADAIDELEEVLNDHGYELGGVASELVDSLTTVTDVVDEPMMNWSDLEVEVEVTYESARSDSVMTKTGIVETVDQQTLVNKSVGFRRDDDVFMKIEGNDLRSTHSRYPYVGSVEQVSVSV